MTILGVLMAVAGIVGCAGLFTGVLPLTGLLADMRIWGGLAIAGVILAILTRRTRD